MGEPRRIQLSRRKGYRMPEGAVKVDRTTEWGNPFVAGETITSGHELWPYLLDLPGVRGDPRGGVMSGPLSSVRIVSVQLAVSLYSCWFIEQPHLMIRAFEELPGRDLACWCKLPGPGRPDICHGAWLLDLVNGDGDE